MTQLVRWSKVYVVHYILSSFFMYIFISVVIYMWNHQSEFETGVWASEILLLSGSVDEPLEDTRLR